VPLCERQDTKLLVSLQKAGTISLVLRGNSLQNFNVEGAENIEVAGDLTYPGTNTSGIGGA
jgi:hypothetical protein